ncbi:FAD-dependent oxidoreductase [Paenibacillus koleovorans]|uniref:FAD-dependent oxidoreductase n=1 Tax=Paenibacillus koleovorans TaxID=121608 RepID=UPI000FD84975|nr:FAD-dependent oxidoreductase [Paenibacillus koleovorans]
MRKETVQSEITVVGGGLAGVCAAIAAARTGQTVSLVQNRPVLGGNSSSEVRVWVSGANAAGTHRYARETGIIGEMLVENQYCNPDGNPYYWDLVLLEKVRAEPHIRLFLNTDVHEVEADGGEDRRDIRSVQGWMSGSERQIRFESRIYVDCTGDGLIGFLAGARYRLGREAREEFGEPWAPEAADGITLGSTILFYTRDAGHPVKYIPPSFARDIARTSIPLRRVIRTGQSGCFYWWIEWGGELDTVHDNERIRDELWSVIYGIWDYIKNSGLFDAAHLTLEWVGSVPGKREYRRFVGDRLLTQHDIMEQTEFEDRIAFGGWSIDLHPPEGVYAAANGSKHLYSDGIYHIPFRSLYSINVANMLMAGRNISASHIAFGTTRVMATCGAMGEAAGVAAALCVQLGVTLRHLYTGHLSRLQQELLRQDAALIGIRNEDPLDWARYAAVSSSGALTAIAIDKPAEQQPLHTDAGLLFPVDPTLAGLELLIDATADTVLELELWNTGREENYVPHTKLDHRSIAVKAGGLQWIKADFNWQPEQPQNAFVIIKANQSVALWVAETPLFGVLGFVKKPEVQPVQLDADSFRMQLVKIWSMRKPVRHPYCFRLSGTSQAYAAEKAIDGYHRPFGGPHLWISEPIRGYTGAWLALTWEQPVLISEVHLTWNDDVNEYLVNLHFLKTPFDRMPELASDYRLEAFIRGQWQVLHRENKNRKRKRIHRFSAVETGNMRVVIEQTNGAPRAELVEIRVYGNTHHE